MYVVLGRCIDSSIYIYIYVVGTSTGIFFFFWGGLRRSRSPPINAENCQDSSNAQTSTAVASPRADRCHGCESPLERDRRCNLKL